MIKWFYLCYLWVGVIFYTALAYPGFDQTIPNGANIRHPCRPDTVWLGLGHKHFAGGGDRNPFGEDFAKADYKWTKELCLADSDGDGRANGEELGDPKCIWKKGDVPERSVGLSHPGVYEPVDSEKCNAIRQCNLQNSWLTCKSSTIKFPTAEEATIKQMDIRFPLTNVPVKQNSYFCVIKELPNDTDYHLVAQQPIINNTFVTHHMTLSGCGKEIADIRKPYNCIKDDHCDDRLLVWSTGSKGYAPPFEAGIPFGKSSYKYVKLQVHWTNYDERVDWYDSSGFRIFYTSRLRKYDMGILRTGQLILEIPPGKRKIVSKATCPAVCTKKMLPHLINVTEVSIYTHYLAQKTTIEQFRNDTKIGDLLKIKFDYRNPLPSTYEPPLQLKPGDELRTTCEFNSASSRNNIYGEGHLDDSCAAFLFYYPKVKEPRRQKLCMNFGRYTNCELLNGTFNYYNGSFGSCNLNDFKEKQHLVENIPKHCGNKPAYCTSLCRYHIDQLHTHPCMKGVIRWTTLELVRNLTTDMQVSIPELQDVCSRTTSPGGKISLLKPLIFLALIGLLL